MAAFVPALALAQQPAPHGAHESLASKWRFQLSAEGAWYENPYFLGAPAGTTWSMNGRASLGREQRFRAGTFTLSGFGELYYPEVDGLNQPTYGGSLNLLWSAGRSTKLNLGQTYERSNTRNLMQFDASGLPLPTSGVDSAISTAGLDRRLSQNWQLNVDGNFTYRRYDDERLTNGNEMVANARLGNRVTRKGMLYLGYVFTSSWIASNALRSHQVLLGGGRKAERGPGFQLAGGVGYLESTASWYPTGLASFDATGRHARFAMGYNRSFGQAFGYGRQMISDVAFATLLWQMSRSVGFNASYNFGYRRDPGDETYKIRSGVASAGFNWVMGGRVAFGARYYWERNVTTGFPVVEGGRATASLSYGVEWR